MDAERPRGRLANDVAFRLDELVGQPLERLVALQEAPAACGEDDGARVPAWIVWLRPRGVRYWQRFFLEAGCGVWEEWSDDGFEEDAADSVRVDVAERWSLGGQRIVAAECREDAGGLARFVWTLGTGELHLARGDEGVGDAASALLFVPRCPEAEVFP